MTSSNGRPAPPKSAARKPKTARKPKPVRAARDHATSIFRDFVQQLEKLDTRPARPARDGAR